VNTHAWPKCASPFWISHQSTWVVRADRQAKGRRFATSFRSDLNLTGGDPVIARVGTTHAGYVFLALTTIGKDEKGRMIDAAGDAFGCRGDAPGPISLKPTAGGCESASPDDLRRAARRMLHDDQSPGRVAWIGPGAP
jgi:hypothetical protein